MAVRSVQVASAAAMEALGAAVASACREGRCIYLNGDLAAGKTTFARGFLRACGHRGAVKSPTFTLVESYRIGGRDIHHFDLYRLADAEELEYIGIDEYFAADTHVLVEWPLRGAGVLPAADLEVGIAIVGECRDVRLEGHENALAEIVSIFEKTYKPID